MEMDAVKLRKVRADWMLDRAVQVQAEVRPQANADWQAVSLACMQPVRPLPDAWQCADGKLTMPGVNLPFSAKVTHAAAKPQYQVDLRLMQASFNNQAGTQAAEKLDVNLKLVLEKQVAGWQWQGELDWTGGELYWQPWYFAQGGHTVVARGHYAGDVVRVDDAQVHLAGVGDTSVQGSWQAGKVQDLQMDAAHLDLAALYKLLLQPVLADSAMGKLEVAGGASVQLQMRQGEPVSAALTLKDVDLADQDGRFALYKLNAFLPWSYDEVKVVQLGYAGGHLLKIPLGEASVLAELNRYSLTASQLYLPVLDGALSVSDVSAAYAGGNWHWHLRANLVPISMPTLSHALGWPRMEGKVAAAVPMMTYSGGQLTVDGDLLFQLFHGAINVRDLRMQTPLGATSTVRADLDIQRLDLGDLTHTFSFGAIEGKLDGSVKKLVLSNWQPVSFDADFHSSPGRYRKKISQRAVENISALGGAGAAAAIQRSVLRFFENFNYEKIGWRCQLSNDVCQMSGVEYTAQGYVIVKGSGIPAITVMGYNHNVGWSDFLSRLKRVTEGNASPVIK